MVVVKGVASTAAEGTVAAAAAAAPARVEEPAASAQPHLMHVATGDGETLLDEPTSAYLATVQGADKENILKVVPALGPGTPPDELFGEHGERIRAARRSVEEAGAKGRGKEGRFCMKCKQVGLIIIMTLSLAGYASPPSPSPTSSVTVPYFHPPPLRRATRYVRAPTRLCAPAASTRPMRTRRAAPADCARPRWRGGSFRHGPSAPSGAHSRVAGATRARGASIARRAAPFALLARGVMR